MINILKWFKQNNQPYLKYAPNKNNIKGFYTCNLCKKVRTINKNTFVVTFVNWIRTHECKNVN